MKFNFLGTDLNVDLGRNDYCLCGSGKKFKRCHELGDPHASTFYHHDDRLWPTLLELFDHALSAIREEIPKLSLVRSGGAPLPANIAVGYYACVGYRVGSALKTLLHFDQGMEVFGLRRELSDSVLALEYYQLVPDEAEKLIWSRHSNKLKLLERWKKSGAAFPYGDAELKLLAELARRERIQHPAIVGQQGAIWREPDLAKMLERLEEHWKKGSQYDEMLRAINNQGPYRIGTSSNIAGPQTFMSGALPSQALHNLFSMSDFYIKWSPSPRLMPVSTALPSAPNQMLETILTSVLAILTGLLRQMKRLSDTRLKYLWSCLAAHRKALDLLVGEGNSP